MYVGFLFSRGIWLQVSCIHQIKTFNAQLIPIQGKLLQPAFSKFVFQLLDSVNFTNLSELLIYLIQNEYFGFSFGIWWMHGARSFASVSFLTQALAALKNVSVFGTEARFGATFGHHKFARFRRFESIPSQEALNVVPEATARVMTSTDCRQRSLSLDLNHFVSTAPNHRTVLSKGSFLYMSYIQRLHT